MKKKYKAVLFFLWFFSWTSLVQTWDWVWNTAPYHGMEAPFWLIQIPFTTRVIYLTMWQAYLYCWIWLHILVIPLLLYWLLKD